MINEQNKHKSKMQKYKKAVDKGISKASKNKNLVIVLTGNGKGKSTSAFGMVMRSLGYGHKVGIIQFIKGQQKTGEEIYISKYHPEVFLYQMNTGFTWNSQDKDNDIKAAENTWQKAKDLLQNPKIDLVVLDEITYMLNYKYLDTQDVIHAIQNRPANQSVILTGRMACQELTNIADTVSIIQDEKHAFKSGIKARKGIDL